MRPLLGKPEASANTTLHRVELKWAAKLTWPLKERIASRKAPESMQRPAHDRGSLGTAHAMLTAKTNVRTSRKPENAPQHPD